LKPGVEIREFIIENHLFGDLEGIEFGDQDSLKKLGVLDSLSIIEFIAYMEDQDGIEVLADEMIPQNLDSVINMASFLRAKLDS
jgi:acyl carrier protein